MKSRSMAYFLCLHHCSVDIASTAPKFSLKSIPRMSVPRLSHLLLHRCRMCCAELNPLSSVSIHNSTISKAMYSEFLNGVVTASWDTSIKITNLEVLLRTPALSGPTGSTNRQTYSIFLAQRHLGPQRDHISTAYQEIGWAPAPHPAYA